MNIPQLTPIVSIIAGILILIMPKLLNYIVAVYLILSMVRPATSSRPSISNRKRSASIWRT
jgi:UPF0716 family protein affecting phage T7 exclusion